MVAMAAIPLRPSYQSRPMDGFYLMLSQLPTTGTFTERFPGAGHRAKHSMCFPSFDAGAP